MRKVIGLGLLWVCMLAFLTASSQAQLVKKVNFSKAEGYKNGQLIGQPVGGDTVWTSFSKNKGDNGVVAGETVFAVSEERMVIHPDNSNDLLDADGVKMDMMYLGLPFPVQKKGPVTLTWDWQFFGTEDLKTDLGFTCSDTENVKLGDSEEWAVFNELSAITRMGDLVDARNGDGNFAGDGSWVSDNGIVYRDGVLIHMRMVVDLVNWTFDIFATREGEEEVQVADDFYIRRGLSEKTGGVNSITMWLNGGNPDTYMTVDNILIVGPEPYTAVDQWSLF